MKYYTLKTTSIKSTPILLLVSAILIMLAIFIMDIHASAHTGSIYEFGNLGVCMLIGMGATSLATVIFVATSK